MVAIVVIGAAWAIWPKSEGKDDDEATITDLAGRKVAVELPVKTAVWADMESFNAYATVVGSDFLDHIVSGLEEFYELYMPIELDGT